MSHRSRRERDTYDSELKDLEYKYYKRLKDGEVKVKISDSSYRCPYCDEKEDYTFKQLLRHADYLAGGSRRRGLREVAQHRALSFYAGKYLEPKHSSSSASKHDSCAPLNDDRSEVVLSSRGVVADIPAEVKNEWGVTKSSSKFKDEQTNELLSSKRGLHSASKPDPCPPLKGDQGVRRKNIPTEVKDERPVAKKRRDELKNEYLEPKPGLHSASKPDHRLPSTDDQGKFVWPCMGIIANIPTEEKDGRRVGESGSKLRDELTAKGYNPVKVVPVWNHFGHTGFAVVEFVKDWDGYKNALMFEKDFEVRRLGRDDFYSRSRGNEMYGWFARERDYHSREKFASHLNQKGDLRSISDVTSENDRKDSSLFSYLQNTLDVKQEHVKEMEEKFEDTKLSIEEVMGQKESMSSLYNEEIIKMQQSVRDDFKKILLERERAKRDVEAQRMELEQQEKQLQEREKHNEHEISKLKQKKEMNEKAIAEQKEAEAKVLSLAQEHQREKEDLHKKIFELETRLDAKQAVELEMEQLRGKLQVLGSMNDDGDPETLKQKEEIREKLEEKQEELEDWDALNQTLLTKHERIDHELKEGRKELINGFLGSGQAGRATIGAKRSGEAKPATKARRVAANEPAELWNFKENREATLVEGLEYICRIWKRLK